MEIINGYNRKKSIFQFSKIKYNMANFSGLNISNCSSNESSELGGVAFFLANIPECLPYVILLLLGATIGILGTIFYKKSIKKKNKKN